MAYTGKKNSNASFRPDKKFAAGSKFGSRPDTASRHIIRENPSDMALGRKNFIYMAVAGAMIVIGFLLMIGPASTPDRFEPDIFSTRRIVVGPTIAFLGFLFMAIAIIINPGRKKNDESPSNQN